jgi:hypothetical protein
MMAFKAKKNSRVPDFRGQQFFTYSEHLKAGTRQGGKGRAAGGGGQRQFVERAQSEAGGVENVLLFGVEPSESPWGKLAGLH